MANRLRKYTVDPNTGSFHQIDNMNLLSGVPVAICYVGTNRFLYIEGVGVLADTFLRLLTFEKGAVRFIKTISSIDDMTGVAYDGKYIWISHDVGGIGGLRISKLDWDGNVIKQYFASTIGVDSALTFDGLYLIGMKTSTSRYVPMKIAGLKMAGVRDVRLAISTEGITFDGKNFYATVNVLSGNINHYNREGNILNIALGGTLGVTPKDITTDGKHFYVVLTT